MRDLYPCSFAIVTGPLFNKSLLSTCYPLEIILGPGNRVGNKASDITEFRF